jgi:nitrite reductase (NO-forming)
MSIKQLVILIIALPAISFLFSCGGNSSSTAGGSNLPMNDTALGEIVYKRVCLVCHQANGQGIPNTFPPLAKSDYLADRSKAIHQVLKGSNGPLTVNGNTFNNVMPPPMLSDDEVAEVLTYVYASWGNNGARVTVDEVRAIKAKN